MRIGIDVSRANRDKKTGVEWYVFFLIQAMKKLSLPDNIEIILYSEGLLKGKLSNLPNNWVSKVLFWPPRRLWTQLRMSFEMLVNPPDVLFIPGHVFPLIHPKKTVMTVHDIAAWHFPEAYNWFEHWYSLWTPRMATKQLWRIIMPSEFTKQEVLSYTKSVQKEKIYVIPHGVDPIFFQASPADIINSTLQKYGIQQPYIFFVGRIETKKNIGRLLESFEQLKKQFPTYANLQLVLAGKPGFGYEHVQHQIGQSLFKKDIIETGWITTADLSVLMHSAKLFVFPSLYEGFGMPILEAFASGVPVVATDGSSLNEVGGNAAVLVNPKNVHEFICAFDSILSNEQKRLELITKGTERVRQYSWDRVARETMEVLIGNVKKI